MKHFVLFEQGEDNPETCHGIIIAEDADSAARIIDSTVLKHEAFKNKNGTFFLDEPHDEGHLGWYLQSIKVLGSRPEAMIKHDA